TCSRPACCTTCCCSVRSWHGRWRASSPGAAASRRRKDLSRRHRDRRCAHGRRRRRGVVRVRRVAAPALGRRAGILLGTPLSTMTADPWPRLPIEEWHETCDTLHMWSQVVGKLTLRTTPLVNHYWNVAYQLNARGLATRPMMVGGRTLVAAFDFISHEL